MKSSWLIVLCMLLLLAGCKPAAPSASGGDEDTLPKQGGDGEQPPKSPDDETQITDDDLPKNPARDLTEEQKQVDAMDVSSLVEALGDDKLYLVAVDELKTRGPEAVEPLTAALDSTDDDVRQSAMLALGMLGEHAKSALPKLKAIAADDDQPEIITATAANAVDAIEGN
jgi:hypothetical protein